MDLNLQLFNDALNFAADVHRTQTRKGSDLPYITHPLAVALLLARAGENEQTIIAGILHDTIEDFVPYGSITKELIAERFGETVARIVADLSEEDKTLPWLERKKAALKHIPLMQRDSLSVKTADVLHNLVCLLDDIERQGTKVFAKFNAPQEDIIGRYQSLLAALEEKWAENQLLGELRVAVEKLEKYST